MGQRDHKSGAGREDSMCERGLNASNLRDLGVVFISLVNLILCECVYVYNSVANFKEDNSCRRRQSPGKTQSLSQWLSKGVQVWAWILEGCRDHTNVQGICECGCICESRERGCVSFH